MFVPWLPDFCREIICGHVMVRVLNDDVLGLDVSTVAMLEGQGLRFMKVLQG